MAEVLLDSGPDSVNELRTLLGDPRHPQRRRLIVVVLGELRAFDAVPELTAALRDRDDELCARACHALGKIGDPESAGAARGRRDRRRAPLVRAHRRGRRLRADRRPAHRRHAGRRARQRGVVPAQRRGGSAGRGSRTPASPRSAAASPRSSPSRSRTTGACSTPPAGRRRSSSAPPPASAGCGGSSTRRHAPARPPGSRSWPARETAVGRYAGARSARTARDPEPAARPAPRHAPLAAVAA